MKKSQREPTVEDLGSWLESLAEKLIPKSDEPPKGFCNIPEAAKRLGLSNQQAGKRLRVGVSAGILERVRVMRFCGCKRVHVWYYGPKRKS